MATIIAAVLISRAGIFILPWVYPSRRAVNVYTLVDRFLTNHWRPAGLLAGQQTRERLQTSEAAKVQAVSPFRRERRGFLGQDRGKMNE
jgi:hypothetical protein